MSRPDHPAVPGWPVVDLPHDFVIEGDVSKSAPPNEGFLPGDEACYVRRFDLPENDRGRRIGIEFDGVYRESSLFCNGHFLGRRRSGYASFAVDLTEVCEFGGLNAVAVFVDAREKELWSYEGGGIYRGVRLVKTHPLHIPPRGVFVRTGGPDDPGRTRVETVVRNRTYEKARVALVLRVLGPDRDEIMTERTCLEVPAQADATAHSEVAVTRPAMWAPDTPALYTLAVELHVGEEPVDRFEQPFGYRHFRFDPQTGFHLNGRPVKLKGTCVHQDHAGVGVAVPPDLHAWRMARLKQIGCNAIRTSHNPPDPALLDACDRLGMLVMDEIRMPGACPGLLTDLEDLVLRDRNHPSVILWSLGNEEARIHDREPGLRIFRRMRHAARRLDPGRPVTYACNRKWVEISRFHDEQGFRLDVWGANYRSRQDASAYDEFHERFPDWPMLGSETWGGGATRGLYAPDEGSAPATIAPRWLEGPYLAGWEDERRYVSAYENWHTPWGCSLEETWRDCAARPFLAGTFIWTGFDYRGEASPYGWPAVLSRFGLLDYCGFEKEIAHYLRAWWRPEIPHVFLMPHWTWPGREGDPIRIRCYANVAEVELFLNGRSLCREPMPPLGSLEWEAPYEPGELRAQGYDAGGAGVAAAANRTAGAPAAIRLYGERMGRIVVVNAAITDSAGILCPSARHELAFAVEGAARLIGAGNGDPLSHEPDRERNRRRAYHGLCQAILEIPEPSASFRFRASGPGLAEAQMASEEVHGSTP